MHDELVAEIARQVAEFYATRKPFRVFHGSTNSTRVQKFKRAETIDVSALHQVLKIDTQARSALVEPNVSMGQLVQKTLKHELIPPVVMEFPGITVGGGIQGGGGESSSFRYGCFNAICNSYEVVQADGTVIDCSPKLRGDLFYGMAGSYGSLGLLTAVELQLVPAKKYVIVEYRPVDNFQKAVTEIKAATIDPTIDFVDGILYAKDRGVIITGKLNDTPTGRLRRFARARDDWFYLRAEKVTRANETVTESVPLVDYLFRYDRGGFWTGQYTFERARYPFNRFTRWLLNPMLNARKLYQALQETNAGQQYIVQDVALPQARAVDYLEFLDQTFGQYPLWLCPLKPDTDSPFLCNHIDTDMAINIGVWLGQRYISRDEFVALNRRMEEELTGHGGKKWFYAQSFYPEDEFWGIYDKNWYDNLRKKYKADTLPTIYQKVISTPQPVRSIKKAAIKTLFGRANLRIE